MTHVTSRCMHFIFCQGREFKPTDKSVLPVTAKEQSFEKVMIIQGTQEKSSELHIHIIYSDSIFHAISLYLLFIHVSLQRHYQFFGGGNLPQATIFRGH